MTKVLRQALIGYRMATLLVAAGMFGVSILIVYMFEALGGLETMRQVEAFLPETVKALMKAQGGGFATDVAGFLAADYRHPIYLVGTAAFAIALASGAAAREIERGTILLVLAAPVARWRFFLGKALALAVGLVAICVGAWAGTWIGALVNGLGGEVGAVLFMKVTLNLLALSLAIGSYTMLLSAASSDGGQTTAVASAVTITMFFVDFLAGIWDLLSPLGPLSVFYYFDPLTIAETGALPARDLIVLFGAALAGTGAAMVVFQRRDIAR